MGLRPAAAPAGGRGKANAERQTRQEAAERFIILKKRSYDGDCEQQRLRHHENLEERCTLERH
jgi:hypothetical protein